MIYEWFYSIILGTSDAVYCPVVVCCVKLIIYKLIMKILSAINIKSYCGKVIT